MMTTIDDEIAEAEAQWARAETLEEIWHARARLDEIYGSIDRWIEACLSRGIDPGAILMDPPVVAR